MVQLFFFCPAIGRGGPRGSG